MSFRSIENKKSQKRGEGDSMIWEAYAMKKLVILEDVIQGIVERKDQVPHQLLEVAKAILKSSSSISVSDYDLTLPAYSY